MGVPYIATDHLRLVVMSYFKGEDREIAFPFETMFNKAGFDEFFRNCSGQEMLQADLIEARVLWSGIQAFIDHMIMSNTDYIFEGTHLLPSLVKYYEENKNVKVVYLFKKDTLKIFDGLKENKNNNDWIASNVTSEKILLNAADSLSEYGKYFYEEAVSHNFKYVNTEDNFSECIEKAINYLKD